MLLQVTPPNMECTLHKDKDHLSLMAKSGGAAGKCVNVPSTRLKVRERRGNICLSVVKKINCDF